MASIVAATAAAPPAVSDARDVDATVTSNTSSVENMLRHDPGILSVLEEACLPSATTGDPVALDGRKMKTMLRRSSSLLESHALGAVVSLPGKGKTKDQTIHVDAEHLYERHHLPPHYLVMFLPALSASDHGHHANEKGESKAHGAKNELAFEVGQTAFVAGSHRYDVARHITRDGKEAAQARRWRIGKDDRKAGSSNAVTRQSGTGLRKGEDGAHERAVVLRPHCKAGDVILFDARILHFGIANASLEVYRPLLFVNYSRPWFSDYQPGGEIIVRHR